jgi:hypothetical protein
LEELLPLPPLPEPPPLLTNVKVGMTGTVGVERTKITVDVAVGDMVGLGRVGVNVGVKVKVGMAATVCVDAALAVCAMMVLISFGSAVGKDVVVMAGPHAITNTSAVNRYRSFVLRVDI